MFNPEKQNQEQINNNEDNLKSEEKLNKIDDIFDDLIATVSDAPEAKQEALRILMEQIRQIGEQMKQVRDMKNLQEIKTTMMKHWKELIELAEGDSELLAKIQNWGDEFVEKKVLYYELIEDVKEDLIDKAQEIQEVWDDMSVDLGIVCGIVPDGFLIRDLYLNKGDDFLKFNSGLEMYISGLTSSEAGHDSGDLPVEKVNAFLENLNGLFMRISSSAQETELGKGGRYIDNYPEIGEILSRLQGNKKKISKRVKESNNIFKVVKKIRDTHFLNLYNKQ